MSPRPELDPHWTALYPEKRPAPAPPRCKSCGEPWPRAHDVCGPRCAASLAEMETTFALGGCTPEERDLADAVEAAMTNAAEQAAAVERWRTGRD